MFRIEADHAFSGFKDIAEDQLQKVAFALAAIAKDQNIAVGFIIVPLVEVHDYIRAELIAAQVKAMGICFARIIKGVQVGGGACGQDPLKLAGKRIPA